MTTDTLNRRLFVPLANEPFRWFAGGQKHWELRRYGRQYTERHVRVGRQVELRRGYNSEDSLWGVVTETLPASSIREFFSKVNYKTVVPSARSEAEAIEIVNQILGMSDDSQTAVFAFRIEIAA
jgi:hypothetical protein